MNVNERIEQMRSLMKERKIDVYYVPNEDDHLSEEYTATYFQAKSWLSGFSGDSGCLIITKDFAGLWTDGRYFTQAEGELKGTCVTLMRLRQPGVPDPLQYLIDETPEKGTLGFDGRVVSTQNAKELSAALMKKGAKLHMSDDLAGMVWGQERPAMPKDPLYVLNRKYTGEDASERIARVRESMKQYHANVLVLTRLEDPCWMLNLRGNDIACTPVAYAFALISDRRVVYYVDQDKVTEEVRKHLKAAKVTVKDYDKLSEDLSELHDKTVWADLNTLNASLYASLDTSCRILNMNSPVVLFRAVKNSTEIRNIRNAHLKDAVAMVNFIYWLKSNSMKGQTEYTAAMKLDGLRAEQKDFLETSFETISAYKANAAMMHYTATDKKAAKLKDEGFLLVDSGGTYRDGTTDITRTIALGELSDSEKLYYTLVLKGHLALAHASFLYGTCGNNLDILARLPLWNQDIDYQCGTGHGVGHVLSVHEGPQGIRWGLPTKARPSAVLEPGMIVTDEPGVYLPHKLGIRIENELLVTKGRRNFYGQFLHFENLTYVPYERDAIVVDLLNDEELEWINAYHQMVWEKVSPKVSGKVKAWLKEATAEIIR